MKLAALVVGISMAGGVCLPALADPVLGFGERTRGGAGGRILMVTRRDDDSRHPREGSLRWAVKQEGPRVVKFAVSGDIELEDRLIVREPFLTVDGSDAPGDGVCIRNGSLMIKDTHDVLVRQVRIRLGEGPAKKQRQEAHAARPPHSSGLDCVSLDDSTRVVFDHCSLSWSCDEIFGITHCREVTIQWCILSEPLANPKLHPYGDHHAFPINASASTLSVHHCLMAHYVMRGPQFEANDMRLEDVYPVQMEAVNNVMFDYEHSGSRYGSGVEKDNGTAEGKVFRFQFINNWYVTDSERRLTIEAITKHGVIPGVKVYAAGDVRQVVTRARPAVETRVPGAAFKGQPALLAPAEGRADSVRTELVRGPYWAMKEETAALRAQARTRPLFITSATLGAGANQDVLERVLAGAGCSERDATDRRVIADVRSHRFNKVAHSKPGLLQWLRF